MSYNHFTISERAKLELLYKQGKNIREISKELGNHYSSIGRELNRNSKINKYDREKAQKESKIRKQGCGRRVKLTDSVKREIVEKLKLTYSPEQIEHTLTTGKLVLKTFIRGYIKVLLK